MLLALGEISRSDAEEVEQEHRSHRWGLVCFRGGKVLKRLAEFMLAFNQAAQNPVDESGTAVGPIGLGEFNRLVDGYLDGRFLVNGKFPQRDT